MTKATFIISKEDARKAMGLPDWVTLEQVVTELGRDVLMVVVSVPDGSVPEADQGYYWQLTPSISEAGQLVLNGFTGPVGSIEVVVHPSIIIRKFLSLPMSSRYRLMHTLGKTVNHPKEMTNLEWSERELKQVDLKKLGAEIELLPEPLEKAAHKVQLK